MAASSIEDSQCKPNHGERPGGASVGGLSFIAGCFRNQPLSLVKVAASGVNPLDTPGST